MPSVKPVPTYGDVAPPPPGPRARTYRLLLAEATATNPRWPEFLRRFAAAGPQPQLVDAARRLLAAEDR